MDKAISSVILISLQETGFRQELRKVWNFNPNKLFVGKGAQSITQIPVFFKIRDFIKEDDAHKEGYLNLPETTMAGAVGIWSRAIGLSYIFA